MNGQRFSVKGYTFLDGKFQVAKIDYSKSSFKRDQTVSIFEDPYTQKRLEGKAVLKGCLQIDKEMEYWIVRFEGETELRFRWIKKPNKIGSDI